MDALYKHIQAKINEALKDEVVEAVTDKEIEAINETVYGKYTPSVYDRRMASGGLTDRTNINGEIVKDGIVAVTNETLVNPYIEDIHTGRMYKSRNADGNEYLAPIIVNGGLYDFNPNGRAYGEERDFIGATKEKLNSSGAHVEALKDGLKKRGVSVK